MWELLQATSHGVVVHQGILRAGLEETHQLSRRPSVDEAPEEFDDITSSGLTKNNKEDGCAGAQSLSIALDRWKVEFFDISHVPPPCIPVCSELKPITCGGTGSRAVEHADVGEQHP